MRVDAAAAEGSAALLAGATHLRVRDGVIPWQKLRNGFVNDPRSADRHNRNLMYPCNGTNDTHGRKNFDANQQPAPLQTPHPIAKTLLQRA
jgi:hypothetical protein